MQPHTHLHKNCWPNLQCIRYFHCCYKAGNSGDISYWLIRCCFHDVKWYHTELPAIRRVLCSSRTVQRHTAPRMCNSWTAASINTKLSCVQPVASKQPRSQSCGLRDLGCHAASCLPQTNLWCGLWMNWDGGSSMSGAVLNSWCLSRLLSSGEDGIEHVSMLKEDISSTACELTMLVLSISVTFNATCLIVTSLLTKSCQQRWLRHSCSFYKVVH